MNNFRPHPYRTVLSVVLTGLILMSGGWFETPLMAASKRHSITQWPEFSRTCRPWSYWWWLGSAVDPTNICRELDRYADAGWGGVHIIPIYGAKGAETRYIPYLSSQWMEMLQLTLMEGRKRDLGVDMTMGTGWCFGGPRVPDAEANASVLIWHTNLVAGQTLPSFGSHHGIQSLMAFSSDGQTLELTDTIQSDGAISWAPSNGDWRVMAVSQKPSGQKVKRAAPGGQGHMLNLIYPEAMRHYLQGFETAFDTATGLRPRAFYHDSYEYRSDWAPDFLEAFAKRRGYPLQTQLPLFWGTNDNDQAARLKCDYRETISDIMIEETLPMWQGWCRQRGFLTRNEAHGSPGNWLDLYAIADMPETEMFYKDRDILISKFASSAAHVAGRPLVSCETGTWLKEHFQETLADMKYLIDDLLVAGVNHVFYHGTCYSPDDAPWPGWLFYASYEMNPRNSIWHDVPALNAYVTRCQSLLQSGKPANDILLYWPIHDQWHNPKGMVQPFTVHARNWFDNQAIGRLARRLWNRGYTFDYISDRQLAEAKRSRDGIQTAGGVYRAILIPECRRMPEQTLSRLLALAKNGATVLFENQLPDDVPGLHDLGHRRAYLRQMIEPLDFGETSSAQVRTRTLGKGRLLVGNPEQALALSGIARESMADHPGLLFIRRYSNWGSDYFVANRGDQVYDGWLPLAIPARSAAIMNPMTGEAGAGRVRQGKNQSTEVRLVLERGESRFVRASRQSQIRGALWAGWQATGPSVPLSGTWQVEFVKGGPVLPPAFHTSQLGSWTQMGDEEAKRFAGTAIYRFRLPAPRQSSAAWWLDLGRVCQSARVRFNGQDLGTLICTPFRVVIDRWRPLDNLLEIEVTNVSANRIRDLDQRGVNWKNFHDINFVNLDYKPFDASSWPLHDSGLIGPVTLQPIAPISEDPRPALISGAQTTIP